MKRMAGTVVLLASLGGCTSITQSPDGRAKANCPTCQTKGVIPQSQLYSAASSPVRPTLTSRQTDPTHLVLSWNGSYVLQTNGDLTVGTWATVTGATTPFAVTLDPATPQLFFRLLSQ